jgi:hypothetical protein
MSRWKPKPPEISWQAIGRRDTRTCDDCGQVHKHHRCVITEQVNWMRGDDEVTFLCISCAVKRGIVPCNHVCRLLVAAMTTEERFVFAERLR